MNSSRRPAENAAASVGNAATEYDAPMKEKRAIFSPPSTVALSNQTWSISGGVESDSDELTVNARSAEEYSIALPREFLARADRVIR